MSSGLFSLRLIFEYSKSESLCDVSVTRINDIFSYVFLRMRKAIFESLEGPVKLIQWVKIANSFLQSASNLCSTLSFQACLCSSTYGCQIIFQNPLLTMEK